MEKIYLLPKTKQYKANLHCHTTLSDGKLTPEQIKLAYKKHGYSIIAYTDHEYIVNHQDLNDDEFIAVTSYEYSVNEEPHGDRTEWTDRRCCHLNFYAKDPYQDKHVCFHPDFVWGPGAKIAATLKYSGELYRRDYNELQHIIDCANDAGFLVCLNHPYWSLQPQSDYFSLKGLFAMEVYNTGCSELSGNSWYDYGLFSEFNQSVAPIAADDNHNGNGDVEHSDSFGGFTMICTDDFSYGGIMTALEKQDFYASTGILFDEISVSDGTLHVRCSECTCIMAYFGGRRWVEVKNSDGVTNADFPIYPGARYIRVFCTDKRNGQKAVTKPFKVTG